MQITFRKIGIAVTISFVLSTGIDISHAADKKLVISVYGFY